MDKLTKLSQAIRYGSTFIEEGRHFSVSMKGVGGCCPIGTACLASGTERKEGENICEAVARRFNVPLEIVDRVSCQHFGRKITRAQAADWLEEQGY